MSNKVSLLPQRPSSISPSCIYLASYAQDILYACEEGGIFRSSAYINGQEFDTDGYNVIVANCRALQ